MTHNPVSAPRADETTLTQKEGRRVILATFVGTTVEWYDFYLYAASAALIFGPQFFPGGDPVAGQIGAFATFAFGFISRPLGGILAGHFGDRIGRKGMLMLSLLVMGVATTLIGLLPTYEQIGLLAPILLTVLRLAQGLGVGAEWGGAITMAIEHAPANRRALYGAAPMIGLPAGLLLSNLMLIVLSAATGPNFLTWGWRIAFLFSIILVGIGIWSRYSLSESPAFARAMDDHPKALPFLVVIRTSWLPLLCTMFISGIPGIPAFLVLTWSLSYGTTSLGYDRGALLFVGILCCLIQMCAMPLLARLSDRGKPRMFVIVGAICIAVSFSLFFPLFETGNIFLAGLAIILVQASTFPVWAVVPPILSRAFPTAVRYTGVSMAYQFGSIVTGGFAPIIATTLLASTGQTYPITLYVLTACVVLAASAIGLGLYYRRRGEPNWE